VQRGAVGVGGGADRGGRVLPEHVPAAAARQHRVQVGTVPAETVDYISDDWAAPVKTAPEDCMQPAAAAFDQWFCSSDSLCR
jgi:hypothetical protein